VIASSGVVTLDLATDLMAHPAAAEIRIEQRGDIVYVKNVEPPPSAGRSGLGGPVCGAERRSTAGALSRPNPRSRGRHGLAPELVESRIRREL
jgi:hypothetical protein